MLVESEHRQFSQFIPVLLCDTVALQPQQRVFQCTQLEIFPVQIKCLWGVLSRVLRKFMNSPEILISVFAMH